MIGVDASRAFLAQPTGIGVYATEVISRLLPQPPAPLRLYLNRRQPPATAPPLAPQSEWRCLPLPRGWTRFRLRRELAAHPVELLWVPAYRLPPGHLPRSVVTVHGVEHRFAPDAYPSAEREQVEDFVQDALSRAARVISPSETTKADLVHLFGADPARITVIPHGVSPVLRPLDAPSCRPELGRLGVRPPYFLVVGAHHRRKNVPFLLERFSEAFPASGGETLPQLVVTNARGAPEAGLSRLGRTLGISDRIRLLGHASGPALAALYSQAVAACIPSLYEGFGLPALEAMTCGAPVLGTAAGGVEEVAQGAALLLAADDRQGWVDGLRRLFREEALRRHLRALGVGRAATFSWGRSARAHAELLERELALTRSGPLTGARPGSAPKR
ncbi:MAG: glycosyltransferase family 4 protein [Candidatus Dormibacteria bacterium]